MVNRILRLPDVRKATGLSRSTIYLRIKQGEFPEPIKLSERSIGWVASEIEDWVERRIAQSRGEAANDAQAVGTEQ